jgi:hypothetical protein
MLQPSRGIAPLKPLDTPLAEYELPRELEDFDFGPQPIKGVATTQVPSFGSVLASAAGAGFSAYSNLYSGTAGDINTTPTTPTTPTGGGFSTYATSTQGFGGSAYSTGDFFTNSADIS